MMARASAALLAAAAADVSACTPTDSGFRSAHRGTPAGWVDADALATGDGALRQLYAAVEDGRLYVRVAGTSEATVLVDIDQDRLHGGWSYGSGLSATAWNLRAAPDAPLERHVGTPQDWTWEPAGIVGFRSYRTGDDTIVSWPHDGAAVRVAAYVDDGAAWLPNPFNPGVRVPEQVQLPAPASSTVRLPARLAFAYQFAPWKVGSCQDVDCAAQVYAQLDHLVLAAGLEDPVHPSSAGTRQLIAALRGRTEVWGYVSHVRHAGRPSTLADVVRRVRQWAQMGATGVFVDDFHLTDPAWDDRRIVGGGAPEVLTRERQSAVIAAAHDAGLAVFANAHSPYDVLGPVHGVASALGRGQAGRPADMYLLENPSVVGGRPVTGIDLQAAGAKYAAAARLRAATGVRLAAVDTSSAPGKPPTTLYALGWWRAVQAGVDAYAFSDPQYAAPDGTDVPVPQPPDGAAEQLRDLVFADHDVTASADGRRSARVLRTGGDGSAWFVVEVGADGMPVRLGVVRS